ncbi:metallophosphoesterase [Allosphingosinicella humi]
MRLWILSDLHIEQSCWDLPDPRPEFDVLVAAGDIHKAQAGVRWLADRAEGRPVIYVPGNHEFYGAILPEELEGARDSASKLGVHFLVDEAVTIGDVRFLGATLWTDYKLMAPSPFTRAEAMKAANKYLNDHALIRITSSKLFTPADALDAHWNSRAWLTKELAINADGIGKTVVVTHHLPDPRSIDPRFDADVLNPAFASRMSNLVERGGADLWIHGHTHSSCDYQAGGCRVICNPKGYGPRWPGGPIENGRFDPTLVVEI